MKEQAFKQTIKANTVIYNEDTGVFLCGSISKYDTTPDPLRALRFSRRGAIGEAKNLSETLDENWSARPIVFEVTVGKPVS